MQTGFRQAMKAGISISIHDMIIPQEKKGLIDAAYGQVQEIENQYQEGLITDGERYNKVIDIWAQTAEQVTTAMMKHISTQTYHAPEGWAGKEKTLTGPAFNSVFIMADSGARGSNAQIRQLAGMRGLMAKPSGDIIETPIIANFREGLSVLQYFVSTHGARKGLADTALKTANSGYLTRRLVDVAQDVIVTEPDCGTKDGIVMTALIEAGEVIESLTSRILGRVTLEDVLDPVSGEVMYKEGTLLEEDQVKAMELAGVDQVKIRSVLTCQSRWGICAACYGRDLARGRIVNNGEATGVIAAQSIGEPGTQLTMRTFHIGGAASRSAEQSTLQTKTKGVVKFHNVNTVKRRDGSTIVMGRNGEVTVIDANNRERERYSVVYGAKLLIADGAPVERGTLVAEWDPYSTPIISEVGGRLEYEDLEEGVTMQEQVDAVTKLSHKVIIESKTDKRPKVLVKDASGNVVQVPGSQRMGRYNLPVGSNLVVENHAEILPGDLLAKIHRETSKTKDITGGLPRVAELFEARKPKDAAVVSEIDGTISFGKDTKGKRKVLVTSEDGTEKEYLIGKGRHLAVNEGDYVKKGEPLVDGPINPHDILKVLGDKALAKYLVDEVQEVYRLQGVKINDKHIEVIVRQMLRKVKVLESGDTRFLSGESVERFQFEEENRKVLGNGGTPATYEPLLLGITKASLTTESFISAASFQETTKVLTEAAINGKVDYLKGLKENVIMGRLVPAGTGLAKYRNLGLKVIESSVDTAPAQEAETASLRTM
jgi:DNA-directed RNA polymerase subunit beta'